MKHIYHMIALVSILFLTHCATYTTKHKTASNESITSSNQIEHSFYLIGDAGNSDLDSSTEALNMLKEEVKNADKNSTLLFLGDNVYEKGLPKKDAEDRALAEHRLKVQIEVGKVFPGRTIFVPGNHDWYNGIKGLKRQEKFVENELGKDSFLPENACPLEKVNISDDTQLIIADTEWYLTNWDKHPTINDECEIRTRDKFLEELESLVKKARGKTTILAFHHPLFTNGTHGGNYSANSHLKPIPVLGTLKNLIRKTGGVSPQDIQNKQYDYLIDRILTIASKNEKVIVVSGHDHNLQLIQKNNLFQIVSGSGSKSSPTKLKDAEFVSSDAGFARLDVYTNGESKVHFFSASQNKEIHNQTLFKQNTEFNKTYPDNFPSNVNATVYKKELIDKNWFDSSAFGNRYRKLFGTEVNVQTVRIDTLLGGLTPVRKGGGNQSKSLRLKDKNGKEYVMRALKKEAVQYLQSFAFKTKNIKGQFEETKTENLVLDIFAGSHPYAPFVVDDLSETVDILHTNPELYYVPKQNALGAFNEDFGDELYMIEERASSGHGDLKSFGYSNKLISTDDLLKNLRKSYKYSVDQPSYVRARLFDMILGDWDRHSDQWRWAAFEENGKTMYKPVPRDRDQAFSRISDGFLMQLVTLLVTDTRILQNYEKDLTQIKWFNVEPYPLDIAVLAKADKSVWDKEVQYLKTNLTDAAIEDALSKLPKEVQDESKDQIIEQLKKRRDDLQRISDEYFHILNRLTVVKGTDKKDWIDIERMPDGKTQIKIYTSEDGQRNNLYYDRTFTKEETKEIWVYALDDDDKISVKGKGDNLIRLKIIGGQNNDVYNIENGKKVTVFDYKSKKNTFKTKARKHLSDDYDLNVYDYKKPKYNKNQFFPVIGSNPDDGFKVGFVDTYFVNGFKRNPFSSKYQLTAEYYFDTQGILLDFNSEFANVFGDYNLLLDATYTSSNYALNFFGFGNETINPEAEDSDNFDLDFNRVRTGILRFEPSIKREGVHGSRLQFGLLAEDIEIEDDNNRFIDPLLAANLVEQDNLQVGANIEYGFLNKNDFLFPTLGMDFVIKGGAKYNFDTEDPFGFVESSVRFDHQLVPSGSLVLSTKLGGKILIGDDYPFFESAVIGADNGVRGFRRQRFSGKQSYYQSTDLRYQFKGRRTSLFPVRLGLYTGFDYGRVWQPDEDSDKWHNSYGGGLFMNLAEIATLNLGLFASTEDTLFSFRLGVAF